MEICTDKEIKRWEVRETEIWRNREIKAECFLPFFSLQKIQLIKDRELIVNLCPLPRPLAGS